MRTKFKLPEFIHILDVLMIIFLCSCSGINQLCTKKEKDSKCGCNPYYERMQKEGTYLKELSSKSVRRCVEDASIKASFLDTQIVDVTLKGCLATTIKRDTLTVKRVIEFLAQIPFPHDEYNSWLICTGKKTDIENRRGVILMDSHIPELVYCDDTRRNGGSNSDDIKELIADFNLISDIIPTNLKWQHEQQIIYKAQDIYKRTSKPTLIIIHASAFYEKTTPMDGNKKLVLFLESLKNEDVRILVYTRGLSNQSPDSVKIRFNNVVGKVNELTGKAFLIVFDPKQETCFNDPVVGMALKNKIRDILAIDEREKSTTK